MTMRNDAKFEEGLTCQLKIDMGNSTNFNLSTGKSQKCVLSGLLLNKVYNVWAKKSIEKFCLMALNIGATFEGKLLLLLLLLSLYLSSVQ